MVDNDTNCFRVRRRRFRLVLDDEVFAGSSSLDRQVGGAGGIGGGGGGGGITIDDNIGGDGMGGNGSEGGIEVTFEDTVIETTCLFIGLITSILVFRGETLVFIDCAGLGGCRFS